VPSGGEPIEEHPSELHLEDVRSWILGDRVLSTFAIRGRGWSSSGTGVVFRREKSFLLWRGACRGSRIEMACRLEPFGDTSTVSMTLGIAGGAGSWLEGAEPLDLERSPAGFTVRLRDRTIADIAIDRRPPSGWIDRRIGAIERRRLAPLILTLAAMPDPSILDASPGIPPIGTTTRAAEVVSRFEPEDARTQRAPQPAFGPDMRSDRPIFFVFEPIGLGGSFPIASRVPEQGEPASLSARFGYSLYTGLDYRGFVQLLFGVESRGVAFDERELAKVSPAGAFEVRGKLRASLALRLTLLRGGPISSYAGLEHVWLLSDEESVFFQTRDASNVSDTGYVLMANFGGRGWAPLLGFRYELGPLLEAGDWWSGASAGILVEGRYELIAWSRPRVTAISLSEEGAVLDEALDAADRWLATYPGSTRSRHGGVRVSLQVRF
jgi:hypothetical protein